jgi:hypothetical protein
MLPVFWGNRCVTLVDWLSQGASFNAAYFNEHILQMMASELHAGEEQKHCPSPLVHMDDARIRAPKRNLARMEELLLKCIPHPPFSPDIAPSDFFLFGWLKSEPSSQQASDINEVFDIVENSERATSDTIARVFRN